MAINHSDHEAGRDTTGPNLSSVLVFPVVVHLLGIVNRYMGAFACYPSLMIRRVEQVAW